MTNKKSSKNIELNQDQIWFLVAPFKYQLINPNELEFREDFELLLGGIYVRKNVEKFSFQFNWQAIFSVICFFSPYSANADTQQNSGYSTKSKINLNNPSIVGETEGIKKFPPSSQVPKIKDSKPDIFDPFTEEEKKRIMEISKLKDFRYKDSKIQLQNSKSLNKNFLEMKKPSVLSKKDGLVRSKNKKNWKQCLFLIVSWVKKNRIKVLLITVIFGTLTLYFYFRFCNKNILPKINDFNFLNLEKNHKSKKYENEEICQISASNNGKSFSNEIQDTSLVVVEEELLPLSKKISKMEEIDISSDSSKQISEIKTQDTSLTIVNDSPSIIIENSSLNKIEIVDSNSNGIEDIILNQPEENLTNDFEKIQNLYTDIDDFSQKNENLKVCISQGKELIEEDQILTKKYEELEKVKNHFLEHGEQETSCHEEWLERAKIIKQELDSQLLARINWEIRNQTFHKDCLNE